MSDDKHRDWIDRGYQAFADRFGDSPELRSWYVNWALDVERAYAEAGDNTFLDEHVIDPRRARHRSGGRRESPD